MLNLCCCSVIIFADVAVYWHLPTDDPAEMEHRNAILEKVAMCAEEHGHYQLACKKFTQGGMHVNVSDYALSLENVF